MIPPDMIKELEDHFVMLEKKILKYKKDFQELQEKYRELAGELEQMKLKYELGRQQNQELAEQNKNIKLQASISGNPDHNRLMKNHINRLIKEVDFCITQLRNNGL